MRRILLYPVQLVAVSVSQAGTSSIGSKQLTSHANPHHENGPVGLAREQLLDYSSYDGTLEENTTTRGISEFDAYHHGGSGRDKPWRVRIFLGSTNLALALCPLGRLCLATSGHAPISR